MSYEELVILQGMFEEEARTRGIMFRDKEERKEAEMDYISQYEDGNMTPSIYCLIH